MENKPDPLHQLSEIKTMMEKSSRFLSLSGLSGVSAGIVALIGAYLAYQLIGKTPSDDIYQYQGGVENVINSQLFLIALGTLGVSIIVIFLFTYKKSQKLKIPIWTHATKRMAIGLAIPLITGGLFLLKIIDLGYLGLIAPGCLIFYGLSLVNASKIQ